MKHKRSRCSKSEETIRDRREASHLTCSLENLETDFGVLCEVCRLVRESSLEKKTCERILKLIGKSIEYSSASLFLLDKRKNQIEDVASVGKKVDLIDFVKFNSGSGFSAWVAMEKRPILLSNLHRRRFQNGIRSFLSVPLILREELFGVVNLSHIKPNAFGPKDLKFLTEISSPIALGLERMFYYSEMATRQKELEEIKSYLRELQNELSKSEKRASFSQFLGHLDRKIKSPLSAIAENAQFLLKSISSTDKQKSLDSIKKVNHKFKKRLREITVEANQITKATEKLLKMNAYSMASKKDHPKPIPLEQLSISAKHVEEVK
jgi:transcriptional regulator with GAF, ATPase, and Fis domain